MNTNTQAKIMNTRFRTVASILSTGLWVNASEFFRNEVLLKKYWVEHYRSLGMIFPSEPVNGMMWIVWGFLYALSIFAISRKFNLVHTTLISCGMAFMMMWVVTWNLHVLPIEILPYAVPLSALEAFVGSSICMKLSPARG